MFTICYGLNVTQNSYVETLTLNGDGDLWKEIRVRLHHKVEILMMGLVPL